MIGCSSMNFLIPPNESFYYALMISLKSKQYVKKPHNKSQIIKDVNCLKKNDKIQKNKFKTFYDFEKANKINVNVFIKNKSNFNILYKSPLLFEKKANILLFKNEYYPITNIQRFLNPTNKIYTCLNCLKYFNSSSNKNSWQKHSRSCSINTFKESELKVPYKIQNLQFENLASSSIKPFVIYCDFESVLKNIKILKGKKIKCFQKHEIATVGFKRVCLVNNEFSSDIISIHLKENIIMKFYECLFKQEEIINNIIKNVNFEIDMTLSEENDFKNRYQCYICKLFLPKSHLYKDHSHLKKKKKIL